MSIENEVEPCGGCSWNRQVHHGFGLTLADCYASRTRCPRSVPAAPDVFRRQCRYRRHEGRPASP